MIVLQRQRMCYCEANNMLMHNLLLLLPSSCQLRDVPRPFPPPSPPPPRNPPFHTSHNGWSIKFHLLELQMVFTVTSSNFRSMFHFENTAIELSSFHSLFQAFRWWGAGEKNNNLKPLFNPCTYLHVFLVQKDDFYLMPKCCWFQWFFFSDG